jgi:hypothetical protein
MSVPMAVRRRLQRLEAEYSPGTQAPPTAEDLTIIAAAVAETGRPWADLTIEEILRADAYRDGERAHLERVAAAMPPDRRRA